MQDKISIFDIINHITILKDDLNFDDENIDKAYDVFMVNRWLSMIPGYIPYLKSVNYGNISKKSHYNYLKTIIPKHKVYLKYMKKDVENKEKLEAIANFYNVTIETANFYMKKLSEHDIEKIVNYIKNFRKDQN